MQAKHTKKITQNIVSINIFQSNTGLGMIRHPKVHHADPTWASCTLTCRATPPSLTLFARDAPTLERRLSFLLERFRAPQAMRWQFIVLLQSAAITVASFVGGLGLLPGHSNLLTQAGAPPLPP